MSETAWVQPPLFRLFPPLEAVPRLHGIPPSVAGYEVAFRCGHAGHVWGRPRTGSWFSCRPCQGQRQVTAARPAGLVICSSQVAAFPLERAA